MLNNFGYLFHQWQAERQTLLFSLVVCIFCRCPIIRWKGSNILSKTHSCFVETKSTYSFVFCQMLVLLGACIAYNMHNIKASVVNIHRGIYQMAQYYFSFFSVLFTVWTWHRFNLSEFSYIQVNNIRLCVSRMIQQKFHFKRVPFICLLSGRALFDRPKCVEFVEQQNDGNQPNFFFFFFSLYIKWNNKLMINSLK